MNEEIIKKIDSGRFLNSFKRQNEWGGADVIISSNLNERIRVE